MERAKPYLKPLVILSAGLLIGAFVGYRAGAWGFASAPDSNPNTTTVCTPTDPPVNATVASAAPSTQLQGTLHHYYMAGSKSAPIIPADQLRFLQSSDLILLFGGTTTIANPNDADATAPPTIPPAKP